MFSLKDLTRATYMEPLSIYIILYYGHHQDHVKCPDFKEVSSFQKCVVLYTFLCTHVRSRGPGIVPFD